MSSRGFVLALASLPVVLWALPHGAAQVSGPLPAANAGPTQPAPAQPAPAQPPPARALAPSVVRLVEAGAEPRAVLRYETAIGTRDMMMVTTTAHTTMTMPGLGAQHTLMPTTRAMVEVGPIGDAGAGRMMVPFRFTAVDLLPTEGVSAAALEAARVELAPLIGLAGFQLIDRQGIGSSVDIVIPPGTPRALTEHIQQMRRSLKDMLAPFPAEPVGVGAVWEVTSQVESNGVLADQVTTFRLLSRAGEEIVLGVDVAQSASAQALPPPQPGTTARLESLATRGTGSLELKLSHLIPASYWQTRTVLDARVGAAEMPGFEQPLRVDVDLQVWFGLPPAAAP